MRSNKSWDVEETIDLYQHYMTYGDHYERYPEEFLAKRHARAIEIRLNLIRLRHEQRKLLKADHGVIRYLKEQCDLFTRDGIWWFKKFMMIEDEVFAYQCAMGDFDDKPKPKKKVMRIAKLDLYKEQPTPQRAEEEDISEEWDPNFTIV
jgi:hypothetical protein